MSMSETLNNFLDGHQWYGTVYADTALWGWLELCCSQGKMKGFTGVDDTYEPPVNPDIAIDTSNSTIEESIETILAELRNRGFINS